MTLVPKVLAVALVAAGSLAAQPPATPPAPAARVAAKPAAPAAQQPATPAAPAAPFSNEALKYSVNWPSGLSLGEAQMVSKRAGDRWQFVLSLDAAVPGFVVSDSYQSVAAADFCSVEFVKTFTHGKKKGGEKLAFDAQNQTFTRTTLVAGGGKSETSVPACSRDALAYLYFVRRELASGRLPSTQTVYFGAPYQVRLEFGGSQRIRVSDRMTDAERVHASVKGPASEIAFDLFFAKDAARTPLAVRVPFPVGAITMELVR